jgi:hypothetical protein
MRGTSFLLFVAFLVVSLAGVSGAATPWLALEGSASTYAMDDVNNDLAAQNALIGPGQPNFKMIENGVQFGAGGGFDFTRGVSVGIAVERLMAKSKLSDRFGSITYDMPADLVRLFAEYRPGAARKAGLLLGASVGRLMQNGSVSLAFPGFDSSIKVEGDGIAGEAYGGGRLNVSPRFALLGTLGYRLANAKHVTAERQDVHNADGSDYTIDFSGVFVRLGLRISNPE